MPARKKIAAVVSTTRAAVAAWITAESRFIATAGDPDHTCVTAHPIIVICTNANRISEPVAAGSVT